MSGISWSRVAAAAWAVATAVVWSAGLTGCPDQPEGDDDATDLSGHGATCAGDEDCMEGLRCAGNGTCLYSKEPGTASEGEDCVATEYCRWGLVCNHGGVCAQPGTEGTAGRGEACASDTDCEAMMACTDGACYGFPVPLWPGVDCADPESDPGPFRVLFEVPGDEPPAEFYRLPFPNDIRVHDGRLDLSGHPSPGPLVPELGDVVGNTISVLEGEVEGFSNNATVFMRFSGRVDYASIELGYQEYGASVYVVDITAGTQEYGAEQAIGYQADTEPGKYICDNWIAIFNGAGAPYQAGHTFAAVVTTAVTRRDTGEHLAQDADFAAILLDSPPGETRLEPAWEAYAPFRAWLDDAGIDSATIAGAAVFTVQDPMQDAATLRASVRELGTPALNGLHLCEEGDPGPYAGDDDPDRGCSEVSEAFDEIQGTISLPLFQEGSPPFKEAGDGGGLHRTEEGTIAPVGTEPVVFALTIPKAERPEDGWPIILYAHGTDGNYRSFITGGMAEWLSDVVTAGGNHVRFAMIGIDQVLNGPRAHPENWDDAWLAFDPSAYEPDVLFYNVLNPRAARTNLLQAAADHFALVQVVESLVWTAEQSPTGEAVFFDPDNVYFVGHGQGAAAGVAFLAWEPLVHAAVLAGAGGLDLELLVNKTKPADLPAMVRAATADPDIDRYHPALNLVQSAWERSEVVDYARSVLRQPDENVGPHHLLMVYGLGDSYMPDPSQYALLKGLRIQQVTNGHAPLEDVSTVAGDVSGNIWAAGEAITGVAPLYDGTEGSDAHFAIYDNEDARYQVSQFLATAVTNGIPTLPALE